MNNKKIWSQVYKDDLGGFPGYDINGNIIDEKLAAATRKSFGIEDSVENLDMLTPEEQEEFQYHVEKEKDLTLAWAPGEMERYELLKRKLFGE